MNPVTPPEPRKTPPTAPTAQPRAAKEPPVPADASFDHVMEKIALEMAPAFWSNEEKK